MDDGSDFDNDDVFDFANATIIDGAGINSVGQSDYSATSSPFGSPLVHSSNLGSFRAIQADAQRPLTQINQPRPDSSTGSHATSDAPLRPLEEAASAAAGASAVAGVGSGVTANSSTLAFDSANTNTNTSTASNIPAASHPVEIPSAFASRCGSPKDASRHQSSTHSLREPRVDVGSGELAQQSQQGQEQQQHSTEAGSLDGGGRNSVGSAGFSGSVSRLVPHSFEPTVVSSSYHSATPASASTHGFGFDSYRNSGAFASSVSECGSVSGSAPIAFGMSPVRAPLAFQPGSSMGQSHFRTPGAGSSSMAYNGSGLPVARSSAGRPFSGSSLGNYTGNSSGNSTSGMSSSGAGMYSSSLTTSAAAAAPSSLFAQAQPFPSSLGSSGSSKQRARSYAAIARHNSLGGTDEGGFGALREVAASPLPTGRRSLLSSMLAGQVADQCESRRRASETPYSRQALPISNGTINTVTTAGSAGAAARFPRRPMSHCQQQQPALSQQFAQPPSQSACAYSQSYAQAQAGTATPLDEEQPLSPPSSPHIGTAATPLHDPLRSDDDSNSLGAAREPMTCECVPGYLPRWRSSLLHVVDHPIESTGGGAQQLDLANRPTSEVLEMIARVLQKVLDRNDARPRQSPTDIDSNAASFCSTDSTIGSYSGTKSKDMLRRALLRFHSSNIPAISLGAYLLRILKYCPTTNEVFVALLVYFDRIAEGAADADPPFVLDSYNVHRLVIAGVTAASKFFSDVFYKNSRYAKVGGVPADELNCLELEFLALVNYRLHVSVEELQVYGNLLLQT